MLGPKDFNEKQLIIVSADERKRVCVHNGNFCIKDEEGKICSQLSVEKIFAIYVMGRCTITTKILEKLQRFGISVHRYNQALRPLAVLGSKMNGNFVLRGHQYHQAENELPYARFLIYNKCVNQLLLLKKIRKKSDICKKSIIQIEKTLEQMEMIKNADSLRGYEGNIARHFWKAHFEGDEWTGRVPRGKHDRINVLLDIGYTCLSSFIESLLMLYGFDIYKGVFHTLFYDRKSLVFDVMEPCRCIIENEVKKMINLKQIDEKDFGFAHQQFYIKDRTAKMKYMKVLVLAILKYKMELFYFVRNWYRMTMKQDMGYMEFKL